MAERLHGHRHEISRLLLHWSLSRNWGRCSAVLPHHRLLRVDRLSVLLKILRQARDANTLYAGNAWHTRDASDLRVCDRGKVHRVRTCPGLTGCPAALPFLCVLKPDEEFLGVAGDLHGRARLDKVATYAPPIASSKLAQSHEEQVVLLFRPRSRSPSPLALPVVVTCLGDLLIGLCHNSLRLIINNLWIRGLSGYGVKSGGLWLWCRHAVR
mmetsp:Transcript_50310/g.118144  ORF Transcript_50310/g.118144 Transcript_50310/m.118144 type:complete len:212 (+) Transcript_50310:227-862(+)